MPHYKLTYFDLPRRGESTRLLFALACQPFEDVRIPWMGEEWQRLKPKTPFGSLPILEVDGQVYCQSFAINRFLARRFGFAGRSDLERAHVDMAAECVEEFVETTLRPINKETDPAIRESLREKLRGPMNESLGRLEKLLAANGNGDGFFVGDSLTWADLVYHVRVEEYVARVGMEVDWTRFPKLNALKERLAALPKIQVWRQRQEISQPHFKLTYFDGPGRADVSRMLFALAGVDFEDIRLSKEEWLKVKPTTPFGQLPILEVDGTVLCQSRACHRYLATRFGFAGKNEVEQLKVDMLTDCMEDYFGLVIVPIYRCADEAVKLNLTSKAINELTPEFLTKMDKLMQENRGDDTCFVGSGITWADLTFYSLVGLIEMFAISVEWKKWPKLENLVEEMKNLPQIKAKLK